MEGPPQTRPHPKVDQRKARRTAALHRFVRLYGRKAQKGVEPNDRQHDRRLEKEIKRMKPDELDRSLRED